MAIPCLRYFLALAALAACAPTTQAVLVQHLDATVVGSVTGSPVSVWADQSGSTNDALANVGSVYYPSTSQSEAGLAGLDFGASRNDLALFDLPGTLELLNFSGNAAGNHGFSALVAFKVDEMPGVTQHILGTRHTLNHFAIKIDSTGTVILQLNNNINASGSVKVQAGDTVVVGMTYVAATGACRLWESKNKNLTADSQSANANFANGNILRLGEANINSDSTGYLRGMVGEVKLYNHALSDQDLVSGCNLLAEKWADIPAPVDVDWRVIPDDPAFPTDDVVMAAVSIDDTGFVNPLPTDPAGEDCTATIQEALDLVSNAGGGTVFLSEGIYRVNGTLTVSENVTLRGRWRQITADAPAAGTILALYTPGPDPSVRLGGCLRELTFWHPGQDADNIDTNVPFVISGNGMIENITLVNAYNGIDMSASSMCCLRGIYGSPLHVGLTADKSYAVSRYIGIHFSPDIWAWSGLPGSPAPGGAHETYIRSHGVGVNIKEMDGFHLLHSTIAGYWKGLLFQAGVTGDNPQGSVAFLTITDCDYAVHFEDEKGIGMLHCTLQGSERAVWMQGSSSTFDTCTIDSDGYAFYSPTSRNVSLVNCTWSGAVDLGGGAVQEQSYAPVPAFNTVYDTVRKPLKTDLFNVKDYGAVGDGSADDTAAVQAAVAAANANGGGIVFVPDGEYRMTGNLALAAGVELRGNSSGRHVANARDQLGSLLMIEVGAGDANGTPFITMGDYCGIRGMSFHYPDQIWVSGFIEYPFMIQANGVKNYILHCSASNPYQAAELNGDDHLVEFTFFGGLRRTYRANNCTGGRIQYCHIKPDFWRDIWLDGPEGNPRLNLGLFKWNITREGLEVFYLNGCDDYSISSIFNHASHTLFTADDSSGQTLFVSGEQLQQGYNFKNGAKEYDLIHSGCNINNIGDYGSMHGIMTYPGFNGTARFYSGGVSGTPQYGWACDDGTLYLQQSGIGGVSGRGAKGFRCGQNGTLQLVGCASGDYLGFENRGAVTMTDSTFPAGLVYSEAADFVDGNSIPGTYLLSDMNHAPVEDYGLVLDQSSIVFEDALIFPNANPASDSDDARRIQGARSTHGVFYLDVTEPDYSDGKNKSVTLSTYLHMFSNSTVEVYYDSVQGEKLGASYAHNQSTDWVEVSFSVNDARFSGTNDIRIAVTGDALLEYVAVKSSRMPGDPIHTGSIVLDNNDSNDTDSKFWTISNLNSSNLTVSGSSASVNGSPTGSGMFDPGDQFTLTATSVIGWNATHAQAAAAAGTFSSYLAGLASGKIDGPLGGDIGPNSGSVYPGDDSTTFGKNSAEALVYDVDVQNLTSGILYLQKINFALTTIGDRMDFVIYDASANALIEQQWNSSPGVSGDWPLEHGDKIIIGTGASNGGDEYRLTTLTLDVLSALSGYDAWVHFFGGSAVIGTETHDFDADGLGNLREYALDGDPTDRMDRGAPPVLYREGGTLFYNHPMRSDDDSLVYTIETCTDLALGNWTPAGFTRVDTEITGSTLDFVTYEIPTTEPKMFLRLQITR